MATILNTFDRPVIKVDDRDPDVSWANHIARKSLGGVDLAYPYGAEVKSPADGRFIYIVGNGSGGNIGIIYLNDGRRIEMMHLSASVAKNASWVRAGQVIAKSGASGFGKAWHYAPHLHVHMVLANGTRVNLFDYFPAPASSNLTPIGDDDMSAEAERNIKNIHAMLSTGAEVMIGGKVQKFNYGILPIVAHNQTLIARQAGQIGALVVAVNQLAKGDPLNMAAIEDAAERGAKEALDGLTVTIKAS